MRAFFVKAKNLSIVTIIASLILGIVLLARPDEALYAASMICGIALILLGIFAALSYSIKDKNTLLLILGVFAVVAGIIMCVKYRSIVSILVFLFGLFILIGGIVDFAVAIDTRRNGVGAGLYPLCCRQSA
ncbi:MAG: DUF308 domain-containing protein [Clostridiales bacterium]|nr:DUF308 domain-containing protein [Clostridiales bacterium]